MQYRKYGRNGPDVSALGFGAMRLPARREGDWGSVNFTGAKAVIRRALEQGVNFIDTHHGYHHGLSEVAIGRALKGWKGGPVYIQTKTPFYRAEPMSHFKGLIEEALEKLGVECIDYLLFHSMQMKMFKNRGKGFIRLTDWAIKRGYLRHRGFSSHDTPANIRSFIDTGEFSAMVVSYNWLNQDVAKVIAHAARKGMGVSVMNPIGGGHLAADTPAILRLLPGAKTAAEVALRFVMATPGVSVTLSGMSTVEQVDENAATASRKTPMTPRQRQMLKQRLGKIRGKAELICTACGYCMPCPSGVDIPGNLTQLSRARLFGLTEYAKLSFERMRKHRDGDRSALACRKCGKCLPKCPNDVAIIDLLAETADLLSE